mmetsp:Transcript_46640/g.129760  ORF Transcript_46640/g.129760 Transcript_46640/m.129760 type:complete len:254 (+) Transcript_46640:1376-2137(+)
MLGRHPQDAVCEGQPPGSQLAHQGGARSLLGEIQVSPRGYLALHLRQLLHVQRPVSGIVNGEELLKDELYKHGLRLVVRHPALRAPGLLVERPVAPQHLLQVLGVGAHLASDDVREGVNSERPAMSRRAEGNVPSLRRVAPSLLHGLIKGQGAGQVDALRASPLCSRCLPILPVLGHDVLGEQLLVHSVDLLDDPDQPLVGLHGAELQLYDEAVHLVKQEARLHAVSPGLSQDRPGLRLHALHDVHNHQGTVC